LSLKFDLNTIAERECFIFLPNNYNNEEKSYPVVYLHGDKETYNLLKESEFISNLRYIIVGIFANNRLEELTPWPSPALHPKFPNFGGKGEEYLQFIENRLKPTVDQTYRTLTGSESTGLIGFSLGGLITMYAGFRTNCFGNLASISGSFWYSEFVNYAATHTLQNSVENIYLSSGNKEGVGETDIKKEAISSTKRIYDVVIRELSTSRVTLRWDDGDHHDHRLERYNNALLWLQDQFVTQG
jgi:predicted alpha/beta superfamily hydrolase